MFMGELNWLHKVYWDSFGGNAAFLSGAKDKDVPQLTGNGQNGEKEKALDSNSQNIDVSAGLVTKPNCRTIAAPVNKSPSQSDPVQLGTIWFLSGPQSSLLSLLIVLLSQGALCSLLLGPTGATQKMQPGRRMDSSYVVTGKPTLTTPPGFPGVRLWEQNGKSSPRGAGKCCCSSKEREQSCKAKAVGLQMDVCGITHGKVLRCYATGHSLFSL